MDLVKDLKYLAKFILLSCSRALTISNYRQMPHWAFFRLPYFRVFGEGFCFVVNREAQCFVAMYLKADP